MLDIDAMNQRQGYRVQTFQSALELALESDCTQMTVQRVSTARSCSKQLRLPGYLRTVDNFWSGRDALRGQTRSSLACCLRSYRS